MIEKSIPNTKNGFRKKHLKHNLFYWGMLAIPLLQFLLFYVYVNFNSIILVFQKYDKGKFIFGGLENFKKVFYEMTNVSYIKSAISNSLILFVFTTICGVAFSLLSSYYIYKKFKGRELFKVFLFLPSIISIVCLVIMFNYFCEQAIPAIVKALFNKEIRGLISNSNTVFPTVMMYSIFIGLGPQVLIFSGSMNSISDGVMEYSKIEGVKPMRELFTIVIPAIWNTLITYIVVNFAMIFTNQMNLFSFFGPSADYNILTIGYYLYKEIQISATSYSQYPYLATMGSVFTLITIPVTLLVRSLLTKFGPSED